MNKFLVNILLFILFIPNTAISQNTGQTIGNRLSFEQLQFDALFNSRQVISILKLPLAYEDNYSIQIMYDQSILKKTSTFASEAKALAAINASFFNMKIGGSVTYLEMDDSLVTSSGPKQLPDSLLNGVLIISKNNAIKFAIKEPDSVYIKSTLEKAVLGTGPVLLLGGVKTSMPDKEFVSKRHPRTCLCTTDDSLLLITVDGRSKIAEGMSLYELQDFLLSNKCLEAINLDGGGSTTMWMRDKGVVNHPSDKSGERKVANVIIIKEIK